MKNPWDSTTEGIYDWQDDPIAAYADEGAAYRKAMQEAMEAEAAYHMAEELAAIEAEAKYYADVILPKVKPLTDAEAKAKTQIAVAKAKADLAKAKARTSLIEVTLAEIEAKTKLIHNRLLKPAAASITETALNKSYTAVVEANTAIVEANTAIVEANTDLAKAKDEAKAIEEFLVGAGASSILDEFFYNIEGPEANLTKAKVSTVKAKVIAAKTKAFIVKRLVLVNCMFF